MNQQNIVLDALYARRSVRSYVEGRRVEEEKIRQLLQAAMAAPSACNIQPWEFIVVSDDAKLQAMKDSIEKYAQYNAPLAIVVCGNPRWIPWEGDFGLIDCSAAMENMLIAANALGLGSVWIGGFRKDALRRILDIPEDVHPAAVAYFGYPAQAMPEPRTQYQEDAVHWQGYERGRAYPKRPGCIV